jgi:hypothetical protein
LKSCEKFDLVEKKWESIGEMLNSRSAITVTVNDDKIYIAGDSKNIEIFDPKTNTFAVLNLKLESIVNFTTSVAIKKKLLLFQKDKCIEIYIDRDEFKVLKNIPVGNWWSQFSPIVYDTKIYFSRYDENSLWQFDTESSALKKIIKF